MTILPVTQKKKNILQNVKLKKTQKDIIHQDTIMERAKRTKQLIIQVKLTTKNNDPEKSIAKKKTWKEKTTM